jgi:PAS fold
MMALRPLLSKLLFWIAALSALASLALPDPLAARLASLALGAAAGSLLVWRGWKPAARAPAQAPLSTLDDGNLLEATAQIARCCANANHLNDALRGVGRIMAHEIGARNVLVALVEPARVGVDEVRLKPLLDLAVPRRKRAGTPIGSAAAAALRERGIVVDPEAGHALAVLDSGRPVALIEFEALELAVSNAALARLLELVRNELNDVVQRTRTNPGSLSPARLRWLRDQADAPDFLGAVARDIDVSLFVVDPQSMRVMGLSRRAERDFGLRRARVVGKTVAQAFGETIAKVGAQALRQALEHDKTVEAEFHWPTARGQRGANVSLCALRHTDGTPRLLIAMARRLVGDVERGGERRSMPRHGLLRDDACGATPRALPRPVPSSARRADLN